MGTPSSKARQSILGGGLRECQPIHHRAELEDSLHLFRPLHLYASMDLALAHVIDKYAKSRLCCALIMCQ